MSKNCVIVGGTGGLGEHLVKDFIREGYNVYACGTNKKKIQKIGCPGFTFDARVNESINRLSKDLLAGTEENIDVFIYTAGIFKVSPLSAMEPLEIEDMFKVNIVAPILLTRNLIPAFNGSKIVYIGSSSSYNGGADSSIYCATKHALRGFALSMFEELKDKNNRVYFISPAGMKTEMGKSIVGQNYDTFVSPQDVSKFIVGALSYDNEMIPNEVRLNRYRMG